MARPAVVLCTLLLALGGALADTTTVANTRRFFDGTALHGSFSLPGLQFGQKNCFVDSGSANDNSLVVGAGRVVNAPYPNGQSNDYCCKDVGVIVWDPNGGSAQSQAANAPFDGPRYCRIGCPGDEKHTLNYVAVDANAVNTPCSATCYRSGGCNLCLDVGEANVRTCTDFCLTEMAGSSGGRCKNPGSTNIDSCCECFFF